MKLVEDFKLGNYLTFALLAEITFVFIVVILNAFSSRVFEIYPFLNQFTREVMEGLAGKVKDAEQSGMALKIFVNNLLVTIAPLTVFSLQMLPVKGIKAAAVVLAAVIGVFLYLINGLVVGLVIGVLAANMNVSYIILLFITMIHGVLELFAMSAGTLFSGYYLYNTINQGRRDNTGCFFQYLPVAQKLLFKLLPVLVAALAAAAVIETYISAPLAEKIIGV
ncbi:putative membrane protein SpoIIM required for sporulation [Desulfohalotomaculum tongense]|uniref:stage II sporulation protein M n=1 Tax=Desulforadius tongensis TaxID=1216062 RepID=UPI00195EDB36|nr:stage II sporulation protein M [Desulforadius tongensis]MBM7855223.1 putative membrane protein SpoIIM required for sporulation [Desulforadius tongensis]